MSDTQKSVPGRSVQRDTTSQVAGPLKAGKYLAVVVMTVLAVILIKAIWTHADTEKKAQQPPLKPAATTALLGPDLNLDISAAQQAASLPVLPAKPLPLPPSVLPDIAAEAFGKQAEETRRKSPTNVYDADKKIASNGRANNTAAGGDANSNFLQQAANVQVVTVSAKRNTNPSYKILQGKLMAAVLETAINSDLPGMVRAVISKDVYSDAGDRVLLPRGTRLIGQYSSSIATGQTRVVVAWTRAITPQYIDIALGSPSTDELGQAGMTGDVATHFWQIFGTSALLSVLGVAASNTGNSNNVTSSNGYALGNPYQNAVVQGVMNSSGSVLQSRSNIPPTIQVPQGSAIQVFVARDLDFSSIGYYKAM
jgi:type IV secretory pathway VirB10-like protein